jgi:hypothetical protein
MSYTKTIVCLANSWKLGGRCIAGKEVVGNGSHFGAWLRPVSSNPTGEIHEEHTMDDGAKPALLDLIEIPLESHTPHLFQHENHRVAAGKAWRKVGRIDFGRVRAAVDDQSGLLWVNGFHTSNGYNDKILAKEFDDLSGSLRLVKPTKIRLESRTEMSGGEAKPALRAHFWIDGWEYRLKVTDPGAARRVPLGTDLELNPDETLLCISLSEPFHDATFKLVAAVISR